MSEPMEVEHPIDRQIRLEQERLRDEFGVRFGWVNVSEENLDAVLEPPMQRIFGANGRLRFMADDKNPKKRLWAINVGERKEVAGGKERKDEAETNREAYKLSRGG